MKDGFILGVDTTRITNIYSCKEGLSLDSCKVESINKCDLFLIPLGYYTKVLNFSKSLTSNSIVFKGSAMEVKESQI